MLTRTSVGLGVLALATALVSATGASATPAPTPTVGSVTAQLDSLGRQSEQLAEKYNAATIALGTARARLRTAETVSAAAVARRGAAQAEFVRLVQAQYEAGPGNAFGELLSSGSKQGFLDQQNYSDLAASHAAGVIAAYRQASAAADQALAAQRKLATLASAQVAALATARNAVTARSTTLKTLLATLTAAQQRAYAARDAANRAQLQAVTSTSKTTTTKKHKTSSAPSTYSVHAGSAAAQRAIDFALAQRGKPYAWGAAGPGSYDCSGLTMAAWRHGGVNLPHLAASQYNYGHHVGWDELQPGDLIFLYWPIGHVEIYIGNGLAVSAPQTGEDVKIISIAYSRSEFHGATRLT